MRLFSLESQMAVGEALIRLGQLEEATNILDEVAADHPTRIGPLVLLARALHRAQDFESAEQRWRAVLARDPQSFEGLWRLGDILLRRGDIDEAGKLLGQAEAVQPHHDGLQISLARLSTTSNDFATAGRRWAAVLERNPELNEAHLKLAEAVLRVEDWDEVAGHLTLLEQQRPDSPEARLLRARLASRAEEWDSAASLWHAVAAESPSSFEAWFRLGEAHYRRDDFAAAEGALEHAARLQPAGRTGVQVLLARIASGARQWERAAERWAGVAKLSPQSFEAHLRLGEAAVKLDRAEEAERSFRAALAAKPGQRPALRQLALLLQSQERWDEAIQGWKQYLAQHSRAFDGWLGLAAACVEVRRDGEAEVALGIARTLRPLSRQPQRIYRRMIKRGSGGTVDLRGALADAQERENAGDYDKAAASYRELLRQNANSPTVLKRLGRLHSRGKRWVEAELVWRALAALQPKDAATWRKLAQALHHLGRHEEADAAFQQNLALDPAAVPTASMVRRVRRLRQWDEAAALWQRIVDNDPSSSEGWLGLGEALLRSGKAHDAEAALQRAAELDPDNPAPRLLLDRAASVLLGHDEESEDLTEDGHAALKAGLLDEADDAYRAAIAKNPENLEAREGVARILSRREHWADALLEWQEIARRNPRAPAPLLWSARLFGRLGRFAEAEGHLQRARELVPHVGADHFAFARAARATEFLSDAEAFFRSAIAIAPGEAEYPHLFGRHYVELGYLDRAYAVLAPAHAAFPGHRRIAQELASIARVAQTFAIAPLAPELRLPERAVDRIVALASAEPGRRAYEPVSRRVVHVTSSLAGGGGERQLLNSVNGLGRRREVESVTLLCEALSQHDNRRFYLSKIDQAHVTVAEFGEGDLESLQEHAAVRPFLPFLEHLIPRRRRSAVARLVLRLLELRPEIVHCWQDETSVKAALAAVIAGTPRIVMRLGSLRPGKLRERSERSRENLRPLREIYRALLTLPQVHMLNNSRAGADDYAEWLDVPAERIEVLYNGIDCHEFEPADADIAACRVQLKLRPGDPVVGGVFRLIDEKQPLLWLDAVARVAAQHPTAAFVIAGDGPLRDLVLARAAGLGLTQRLHLLGRVTNVPDWVGLMDVMLLTSKVEGLPNVLLEAQAVGVPVVSTPAGGATETFLPGETGWLVGDASAEALAERLNWTLANPEWARAARDRAKRFARERFGAEHMVENTLAAYGWEVARFAAA